MSNIIPQSLEKPIQSLEKPIVNIIKTDEDVNNIISKNRIVIFKLGAKWCGPCQICEPKFHALAEKYSLFTDLDKNMVVFASVDIDKYEGFSDLITSIPAFIFSVDGKIQENNILIGADLNQVENYVIPQIEKLQNTTKI